MFKKTTFLLLMLTNSYVFTQEFPTVIDYEYLPSIEQGYYANFNQYLWQMGGYAFNYAPEITPYFALLKQKYNIDAVVETGTYQGGTTVVFSYLFDEVHTIEIEPNNYNASKERLSPYANVNCHFGSSSEVLKELLPLLKGKRVLFYLDAHWQQYWPLLDELKEISKTHKDQCIIVVDDFKVPGRSDIPYDAYGSLECSFDYIKNQLKSNFSSYTPHYIIPKSPNCRAKFVAIPQNWANKNK